MKLIPTLITSLIFGTSLAQGASVLGINFNNNDGAGAQEPGAGSFGATWTDINDTDGTGGNPVGGTNVALNGTSATMTWSAANFWTAGSWTGTDGFNSEIGTMRAYLDDGGGGYSVSISGLTAWLNNEGASDYTVTLYASTDSAAGTGFEDTSVNGLAVSILELGDGSWDGTSNDPSGNITSGYRGKGTSGTYNNDTLTISSLSGDGRGTLAAIVITAVPEPSSLALLGLGGLALIIRRRK